MAFKQVQTERISHSASQQIKQLILRGILRPGDRLPSERELSENLAVSRPFLREAIANLQAKGVLTTKASAGVFVADMLRSAFSEVLIKLFSNHDEAVFDALSFHRDMEGLFASWAAHLDSDMDLR